MHPRRAIPAHAAAKLALVAIMLLLAACAAAPRREPLATLLAPEQGEPLGLAGLRLYPERAEGAVTAAHAAAWPLPEAPRLRPPALPGPFDELALSGGGDGGAFAVGVLTGWTQAGTRPSFGVVTGVSAGALIAPFAFLGPDYDPVLREVALSSGPDRFFKKRWPVAGLLGDGFSSSEPLKHLIATHVTAAVIGRVADEYRRGRDLYLMTTDLDAGTPVIWDMGAIAASGSPEALELFRQVMLASASVPGVVSPVFIDVSAGRRRYRELHVDGAVTHEVFAYPFSLQFPVAAADEPRPQRVFVIMNVKLEPGSERTAPRALDIGSRAIQMMVETQARNDVERLCETLPERGIPLELAYIDSSFRAPHPRAFDAAYMRKLFAYGRELGASGRAWHGLAPLEEPPPPRTPSEPRPMSASLQH